MDALNASFDLLKSQLFNAGATYHNLCNEGGGGRGTILNS